MLRHQGWNSQTCCIASGPSLKAKATYVAQQWSVKWEASYARLSERREHVTHLPGTFAAFLFQNCFLFASVDIFPLRLKQSRTPTHKRCRYVWNVQFLFIYTRSPPPKLRELPCWYGLIGKQTLLWLVEQTLPCCWPITSEIACSVARKDTDVVVDRLPYITRNCKSCVNQNRDHQRQNQRQGAFDIYSNLFFPF